MSAAVDAPPRRLTTTSQTIGDLILPVLPFIHSDKRAPLPVLEMLHFERRDDVLTVAATDRYTFLVASLDFPGPDVTFDVRAADMASFAKDLRSKQGKSSAVAFIDIGEASVRFDLPTGGSWGFDFALDRDGKPFAFPNYRSLFAPYDQASPELLKAFDVGLNLDQLARFAAIDSKKTVRLLQRGKPDTNRPVLVTPAHPDLRAVTYRGLQMPYRLEAP